MNNPNNISSDSLENALLPGKERTEAEILFSPPTPHPRVPSNLPVKLGETDLSPIPAPIQHDHPDLEEGGMIMGPGHPIFSPKPSADQNNDLRVPPGARFDPISPVGPGFYSPGDPDFDELLPPGPNYNHNPGIRPPRKPKGSNNANQSLGGHPYGAPPGPGNPPFFM